VKNRTKIMMGLLAGGIPKAQAQEWVRDLYTEAEESGYEAGYNEGWEDGSAHTKAAK